MGGGFFMKVKKEDLRRELEIALEGKDSQTNCAFRLGINQHCFEKYLYRARIHGIEGVLHNKKQKTYTDEFKLKVVHSVVLEGKSKSGIAIKNNLNVGSVHSWVNKYLKGGEESLLSNNRGKWNMGRKKKPKLEDFEPGTIEYLKLENEKLKRENLLLKKVQPLVQEILNNRSKGKSDMSSSEN